jgi:dTDP-4-amino-4,6-dideoxygalactose transaminase
VIPLVDLAFQTQAIADEVREGFARVINTSSLIDGPDVAVFEEEFAAFTGVSHCVGVANGTDALELSLRALGIRAGDEVIVPAFTFVATAAAVVRAGGSPVFADVDPNTLLLDPDAVRRRLSGATRAVIAVHLYGQMAPLEDLAPELAERDIALVEDAAQAQGAKRAGLGMGAVGAVASTSFYPSKNLGAWGDGGAVLTRDGDLAAEIRSLRNHGRDACGEHRSLGWNARLDTLQAVVLLAKLRRLADWNERRRAAADRYSEVLRECPGVRLPTTLPGNEHVWHLYVVKVPCRDAVVEHLRRAGVGVAVHYPVPLHLLPAFADRAPGLALPAAEAAATEVLSLPIFPGIRDDDLERVAVALRDAIGAVVGA